MSASLQRLLSAVSSALADEDGATAAMMLSHDTPPRSRVERLANDILSVRLSPLPLCHSVPLALSLGSRPSTVLTSLPHSLPLSLLQPVSSPALSPPLSSTTSCPAHTPPSLLAPQRPLHPSPLPLPPQRVSPPLPPLRSKQPTAPSRPSAPLSARSRARCGTCPCSRWRCSVSGVLPLPPTPPPPPLLPLQDSTRRRGSGRRLPRARSRSRWGGTGRCCQTGKSGGAR